MPAKREYKVKGTNDFLILAAIFFFLCLWAIKDAWFPSEKVLKKHPVQVDVSFEVSGTVEKVNVEVGDKIVDKQLLASLRRDRIAIEYDESKAAYTEAKNSHAKLEKQLIEAQKGGAGETAAELQAQVSASLETMDQALKVVDDLRERLDFADLHAPNKGQILEVLVAPHTMVEAGQSAFVINPQDHFYLFNKSLTILSFILFWVFLAVHIFAR